MAGNIFPVKLALHFLIEKWKGILWSFDSSFSHALIVFEATTHQPAAYNVQDTAVII